MTRVILNRSAIEGLNTDAGVANGLLTVGEQVAARAAEAAPKQSGSGAASIAAEIAEDPRGAAVHVSWAKDKFYLYFHEVGTSRMSARPFLRPALDGTYTL